MTESAFVGRRHHAVLAAIVMVGLALRIACAQGDLWFDEAWSAVQARDVITPVGVFFGINHDNNHHLNSLWMQWIGFGAAPPLLRGLSIAGGTATILVAARLAERLGHAIALVTAWLFAVSPLLVTLGSEARGYATMALAVVTAVLFIGRWLAGDIAYRRPVALALCFVLGALSQLTMVFCVLALVGWPFLVLAQRHGVRSAAAETARVFAPAIIALALVLALIFLPGWVRGSGFRFGRYDPFELLMYLHGIIEMLGYAVGIPWNGIVVIVVALAALILARRFGASRLPFYVLAMFAFPLMLGVLQSGNVGHARYYLLAGLALLLMLGEMFGTMLVRGGWQRRVGMALLTIFSAGSLWADIELVRNQRADPGAAIRAMMARAPAGTRMLLDRPFSVSMIQAAATHARYRLTIVGRPCADARFLLIDRFKGEPFPPEPVVRCGKRFAPIALGRMTGMTGLNWTLYERRS